MAKQIPQLTDQHVEMLNNAMRAVEATHAVIEKANAAGLDVADYRQQNDMHRQLAQKIKQQFFPNHP